MQRSGAEAITTQIQFTGRVARATCKICMFSIQYLFEVWLIMHVDL